MSSQVHGAQKFDKAKRAETVFSEEAMKTVQTIISHYPPEKIKSALLPVLHVAQAEFGGYLLYSSLFAAVGSAVNEDPQDAQSLLLPITMPIVFGMVIMMKAVNDPNSSLAIFGSLFPLTSPIVMMARVAHGVPEGVSYLQLVLSMVFLILGFLGTTWVAAKIYRIGILMYGKKATWKEMIKWTFRNN